MEKFRFRQFQVYNVSEKGFSLLEVVVSTGVFAIILLTIISFIFWMNYSNSKTKADRQTLENTKRAMETMIFEVKNSDSIYTSTTTSNQLSLQTNRYLQLGENTSYIDFFICGNALCIKKEGQDPSAITSDDVQISALTFTRVNNGTKESIQINLTANYVNPTGELSNAATTSLTSTASPRSY